MTSKPPGLPVFSGAFLQLCLKRSRLFAGLELVRDNRTVRGFSAAETASSARAPLTQPISVINEAKHRVVQRLPEHMCSWGAVGLGWGGRQSRRPSPSPRPFFSPTRCPRLER